MESKYLYRYTCPNYSEEYNPKLTLQKFPVLKITPCGFMIKNPGRYGNENKFILSGSGKRFAHETEVMALTYFIHRKKREQTILTAKLSRSRTQEMIAQIEMQKISVSYYEGIEKIK